MAKAKLVKNEYYKAELVATWLMRFSEEEKGPKKLQEAKRLCLLNGFEPEEFQKILDGAFLQYDYKDLLEINKIINKKRRV